MREGDREGEGERAGERERETGKEGEGGVRGNRNGGRGWLYMYGEGYVSATL